MQPVTPVIPGERRKVTTFGASQPEYKPLPAFVCEGKEGRVITRWRPNWRERVKIAMGGDLWLSQLTFHRPLQPVRLETECSAKGDKQ